MTTVIIIALVLLCGWLAWNLHAAKFDVKVAEDTMHDIAKAYRSAEECRSQLAEYYDAAAQRATRAEEQVKELQAALRRVRDREQAIRGILDKEIPTD